MIYLTKQFVCMYVGAVYYLKDAIHTSSFAQLRSIAATADALTGALAAELSGQHLEKLNTTTLNYDNSTTTTTTTTNAYYQYYYYYYYY